MAEAYKHSGACAARPSGRFRFDSCYQNNRDATATCTARIRMWESLAIRQFGILEIVGSSPTILTATKCVSCPTKGSIHTRNYGRPKVVILGQPRLATAVLDLLEMKAACPLPMPSR